MPADDLVLNVRQIAGYPTTGPLPNDSMLLQRGGLGGAYLSVPVQNLVATSLAYDEGPAMGVGVPPPADAAPSTLFTGGLVTPFDGLWMWNSYIATDGGRFLGNGPWGVFRMDPTIGWQFYGGPAGSAGAPLSPTTIQLEISPTGYLTVGEQILLARDPAGPLEAATAQWVNSVVSGLRQATVWSFNGRRGDVRLWIQDITAAGGAPQFSPAFSGEPRAPTPSPWSCNSRIATTAFVQRNFITGVDNLLKDHPFVFTFNGRTGDIVLTPEDIGNVEGALLNSPALQGIPTAPTAPPGTNTDQLATCAFVNAAISSAINALTGVYAPLDSPAFTGVPTGLTAAPGTSTGQLATTAFVMAAVAASVAGVSTFNTRTGNVTLEALDITNAGGALTDSPTFTGVPTGPTAPLGANTAQLANCTWVLQEIGGANIGVMSFNGRGGAVTLVTTDIVSAGGAPIVSPQLSGVPTAPTAASGVSTQQIATTAFVMDALAQGAGVTSFNGRTGAVSLTFADVSAAGGLANPSPNLTGTPTAPTATAATSTTQIATTAFVQSAIAAGAVVSFNTRTGAVTLTSTDVTNAGGALLASPIFTGSPQAPTAAPGTSTAQLATCAFVAAAIAGVGAGYLPLSGGIMTGPTTFNTQASAIVLNKPASGTQIQIAGNMNGVNRWVEVFGDSSAESGSNAGSNYALFRYSDAGASLGAALSINRATGVATFGASLNIGGGLAMNGGITGLTNLSGTSATFTSSCNAGNSTIGSCTLANGNVSTASPGTFYGTQMSLTQTGAATPSITLGTGGSVILNGTTTLAVGGSCTLGSSSTTVVMIGPGTGGYPGTNNGSSWGVASAAWFQVQSYNFPNPSDRNLKTNIERGLKGVAGPAPRIVSGGAAVPYVDAIPVYTYQWKEPSELDRKFNGGPLTYVGFIADEVQAAFGPQAGIVSSDDKGENLAVSVNQMLAVLWQAVRELSTELTSLKARMA